MLKPCVAVEPQENDRSQEKASDDGPNGAYLPKLVCVPFHARYSAAGFFRPAPGLRGSVGST